MLLADGLSAFPFKDNTVFSNGPKSLPKNYLDCPNLCNWVFESLKVYINRRIICKSFPKPWDLCIS